MNRSFLHSEKEKTQQRILEEIFGGKTKVEVYLEYVNDWLTIDEMRKAYKISEGQLLHIIVDGKKQLELSALKIG